MIPGINDAPRHLEVIPPDVVELQFETPNPAWSDVKQTPALAT